uniref:Uncharacterized protein n=1 Tax=Chromera velia CCMP2878 TaxID=1169474 RepID=A0A0G4FNB9_9ALVE|eukprot:Cvel_17834.t1-p1 / transcript=Cvel_17834.t1 / gene=Cvel_17834 / organism=Chromera_velia_CCMP2878 / gene_product=hypothetical protein / transcript_product=hypothetical protein / location=Cvel_scaffold1446:2884-3606(+) / protein_length=241 / sequence_SO=supercontig / SO=protein_coding / is_pseudo=false
MHRILLFGVLSPCSLCLATSTSRQDPNSLSNLWDRDYPHILVGTDPALQTSARQYLQEGAPPVSSHDPLLCVREGGLCHKEVKDVFDKYASNEKAKSRAACRVESLSEVDFRDSNIDNEVIEACTQDTGTETVIIRSRITLSDDAVQRRKDIFKEQFAKLEADEDGGGGGSVEDQSEQQMEDVLRTLPVPKTDLLPPPMQYIRRVALQGSKNSLHNRRKLDCKVMGDFAREYLISSFCLDY